MYHIYESKKYNKLVKIVKKKKIRLTDIENKLMITSRERGGGRGNIGLGNKR